jgi:hypothetical protein
MKEKHDIIVEISVCIGLNYQLDNTTSLDGWEEILT